MSEFRILMITASSVEEGNRIARALVEERLAACVNIVPKITSVYRWDGEVQSGEESLMIVKTATNVLDRVRDRVHELHSYDVPEFITIEPGEIAPAYEAFLTQSITKD
jgi:periplasmic divalent cation tolerance protein